MPQTLLPLMFLRPALHQQVLRQPRGGWGRFRKMPLRAKVQHPMIANMQNRQLSNDRMQALLRSQPGDDPDDVLFNSHYGVRTIELNRPRKLNSLNGSMARKIIARLLEWQKSDMANIILISGAGPRAFCAGGDVAALAKLNAEGPKGKAESLAYLGLEYQLDHLIATYDRPYVAYMDGVVMGGGAGLSIHAPIRIATERTVFAMPETSIGFFPDVGASFFLPRLDGKIGTYLALTSDRLTGPNAFLAGLATHYAPSAVLPSLTARLAELHFNDYDDLQTRLSLIDDTIAEYSSGFPHDEPVTLLGDLRRAIDRCFQHDTVEKILDSLRAEASDSANEENIRTWANRTQITLRERSPTSLRVALRQMNLGKNWTIREAFEHEYALAKIFMEHPDFVEGVSARLIQKPPKVPQWQPAKISDVSKESIDAMFAPQGQKRLDLISGRNSQGHASASFLEYPNQLGLPREIDVENLVRQGEQTRQTVMAAFMRVGKHKAGIREKVDEILSRCCTAGDDDLLQWIA